MITTAKILSYDGRKLVLEPETSIERDLLKKQIGLVELRLSDGREISNEQRKKIFAIIRDISLWSGHDPEYLRQYLTWDYRSRNSIDVFSLSNVDMTTAKEFINYLIDFCFYHSIPTKDTLLNQTDDIGKYLYLCLEHRKCAICNQPAEVHHVNRIGMGRDREKIVHIGLKAAALCGKHHDAAHRNEQALFTEYCIYGITLDEYLCKRLTLNTKQRGWAVGSSTEKRT
ncbi:MAG: hypothetical protein DBY45_10165 [Clostridiales bacterium]|nr:MAG: hypothetical protein DBY45_10165 [Clostridiales bacterium]